MISAAGPRAAARLSLFTGITAAQGISLVEDAGAGRAGGGGEGDRAAVSVRPGPPGQAEVAVPPAGTVTLGLSVPVPDPPAGTRLPARPPPAPPEPAQPVFTRYWLHGKGPAPAGNLPVAVHLSPGRVALPGRAAGPGAATVRLTVACGPEPAAGIVDLDVPPGLAATPAGPLRYDLPALGHAHWDLAVRGTAGAAAGHYFLAARVRDELGQVLEDATAVMLGGPPAAGPGLPRDALLPPWRPRRRPSRPRWRSPCSHQPSGSGPGRRRNSRSGWPTGPPRRSGARRS